MTNLILLIIFILTALIIVKAYENSNVTIWRISGLRSPPIMSFDESKKIITGGELYNTFFTIQEKLKFRYELVTPVAKSFGREDKNGNWDGMIGQVAHNEADIAFIPIFITSERFKVIDYSQHVSFSHMKFIVNTPARKPNWDSIIRPYSIEMWIAIFSSLIIFSIIYYYLIKKDLETERSKTTWPISKVFWLLFGSFTNKGGDMKSINNLASRLIIGIWMLCSVVIVSSYSGILMSFMTCPLMEKVPTNYDELVEAVLKGQYSCGIPNNQAMIKIVMNSKSGSGKILSDHINNTKGFLVEDPLKKVLESHFAYIGNEYAFKRFHKYGISEFIISKDSLVTFPMAYGIRRGFPHKKNFNKVLSHLYESGIINHLEGVHNDRRKEKLVEIRPLSLKDLLSPIILLLFGYALSSSCFIIEIFLGKTNLFCKSRWT